MIKTVFKELIIILLLCIAILLVLSILLYDYNPINKVVPNKIAYTTPENIRNELEESVDNTVSIENRVYTIDGSDLNIYKKGNSYNPSKKNPFASTSSEDTNTADADGDSGQTNVKPQAPTENSVENTNTTHNNQSSNENKVTKLK